MTQLRRFNMGIAGEADCPVFDGLYEYCQARRAGAAAPSPRRALLLRLLPCRIASQQAT
jgi:hypothetical protein